MYNPTNHLVSVLCQQPCGSSSSEAVKESLTGGQADETDTQRGHFIYMMLCVFVCVSECTVCVCECRLKVRVTDHVLLLIHKSIWHPKCHRSGLSHLLVTVSTQHMALQTSTYPKVW